MALLRFRAWDSVKKEMFKDTFAITESGQVVVVEQESVASPPDYVFVEHLAIMQSTGLVDKNGKEIFEGDIVTDGEFTRIVRYHQTLGFYMFDEEDNERFFSDSATLEDFEEDAKVVSEILEVVGNIYENPELLEVTE